MTGEFSNRLSGNKVSSPAVIDGEIPTIEHNYMYA